jgi:type III secretion system FlhB-like substrate exporter
MDGRAGLRKRAVALLYRQGIPAPLVAAKGEGRLAGRIVDIAHEAGVPVVEDAGAAEALFPLGLGEFIPERYYEAVALILAAVIKVEGER